MVAHRILAVSLAAILSYCTVPIHPNSARHALRHRTAVTSTKTHGPHKKKLTPEAIRYIQAVQRAQLLAYLHALWLNSTLATRTCIMHYESGNYSESSHPDSGSGAYQFVPSTWQTWFTSWTTWAGYGGPSYSYAFQAPAWIQDDVASYTLTHGGQHNWDPSYGNDPCTVNL